MLQKFLIVCAAAFFLTIAITSIAKANGGPHGDYTTTTDACAGCHRAHTAAGANLLIAETEYDLCMTCHGTGASGANTNVNDGVYMARSASTTGLSNTVNSSLIGGGFNKYNRLPVTSKHDVSSGLVIAAWGYSGTVALTPSRGVRRAITSGLKCSSCHNPHGSTNYRIINNSINTIPITVTVTDEGAAKDYGKEHWLSDMSSVCDGCHSAYHVTIPGAATNATVAQHGGYAHRVDMITSNTSVETTGWSSNGGVTVTLPLASQFITGTNTNNLVVCQTCHFPHGGSAAMSGFANGGPTGVDVLPGNTNATDSALLRVANRGVCEACHQK